MDGPDGSSAPRDASRACRRGKGSGTKSGLEGAPAPSDDPAVKPDTRLLPVLVHSRRLLIAAALALIALALGAGGALAATPIDLGPANEGPGLALDAAGAAHLSWASPAPPLGNTPLHYCRIDRGGSGCATSHVFPQVGTFTADFGNAPLLLSSGAVDVLDARFNGNEQKLLWTNANNFIAPTAVASNELVAGTMAFTEALYAPKGTVSAAADVIGTIRGGSNSTGATFQATNLTGVATGSALLSPGSTADATIARNGSTLVVAYIGLGAGRPIFSRTYSGTGTLASLNSSASWAAPVAVDAGDNEVALASGPGGVYLVYQSGSDDTLLLRHFNGLGGWEAPLAVSPPHATEISISEDGAGVVHLVWLDPESGELHYSYGLDASNTAFSRPQTLAVGEARETEVATDAAGVGWVTWKEGSGDAEAIPVEPGEPPLPPAGTGGGSGGGAGGAGGGATPITTPAPVKTAPHSPSGPGAGGPTKSTTAPVVPGLNATLSTPKGCVAGGATFKAKVAVKRKGSKAHKLSYSVKQVGFSVDGKLISTDKTKPFEATLHGSARAGSSIPVAAKIGVLLKKGHRHSSVTKTLTATVATCG
jgi:hypothetical protein